jgi:hypothetical protein
MSERFPSGRKTFDPATSGIRTAVLILNWSRVDSVLRHPNLNPDSGILTVFRAKIDSDLQGPVFNPATSKLMQNPGVLMLIRLQVNSGPTSSNANPNANPAKDPWVLMLIRLPLGF